MASWMSASAVMILLWFCKAVFYPFVKTILLDLLLRVNNLRPLCCHCADVFMDVMSCRRERLSAVIFEAAAEIDPICFHFYKLHPYKAKHACLFWQLLCTPQIELNRKGFFKRLYHNLICPNLLHSALTPYITTHIREQRAAAYSKFSNPCECETCLLFSGPDGKKNPYSWHNIISMSLLENNCICKDGGGIHYQQLGWNDNTHYTAISLHKAANGSNHSTLINKTLSFVSTWRASSIFHWDSHSWARQHKSNILIAGETMSIAISCVDTATSYAEVRINTTQSEIAITEIILCASLQKMTIIYLQELIGLLIDSNESMISLPGAEISVFQNPHPPKTSPTDWHFQLLNSGELCLKEETALWDIPAMKTNKIHSQANKCKWKQMPKLCYYCNI